MTMKQVDKKQVILNTQNGFDMIDDELAKGEYNKIQLAKNLNDFLYQNTAQIILSDMNAEEKRELMNYRSLRILQIIDYIDGYNSDYM